MPETRDFIFAGSAAQRGAIQGISHGHAFGKHGDDVPDAGAREFGAAAMRDLNTATTIHEFKQSGQNGILFGNTGSGMVGWINTSEPEKSTYFSPGSGVAAYIERQIESRPGESREISALEREDINSGISPDDARGFHISPESGLRSISVDQTRTSLEAAVAAPEGAPEVPVERASHPAIERSEPEAGGSDGGPQR